MAAAAALAFFRFAQNAFIRLLTAAFCAAVIARRFGVGAGRGPERAQAPDAGAQRVARLLGRGDDRGRAARQITRYGEGAVDETHRA